MRWRVVAAGAVIAAVCGGGLVWQRIDDRPQPVVGQQGRPSQHQPVEPAQVLPSSPLLALVAVMRAVAELAPHQGCALFSATAAQQWASAAGMRSCEAGFVAMHALVSDPRSYLGGDVPEDSYGAGTVTTVTGCTVSWTAPFSTASTPSPGPRVGTMRVESQPGGGYLITSYQACVG